MERKQVVAQLAEEMLAEFNTHHDARGRFTSAVGDRHPIGPDPAAWLRNLCNDVRGTYLYAGRAKEL